MNKSTPTMRADIMTQAYLEAVYFTDTGDDGQPDADADLTPLFRAQAWIDCRNFLLAIDVRDGEPAIDGLHDIDPARLGYDLWLARNGIQAAFLDRIDDAYTEGNAKLFCRLARAIGEHDAEFIESAAA